MRNTAVPQSWKLIPAALLILVLFAYSSANLASSGGITGQSTAGCTVGGCHGDAPVGTYSYNNTVQRFSGSWLTTNPTIDANGTLTLRFLIEHQGGTAAPAGGFNMSATGGTLTDSSATIDDNGCACGELTHTTPRAAVSNDITFSGITWTAPSNTSGDYTIRACGQPVSQGGDGDDNDGPDDCDTMSVAVRPVISGWTNTPTYNENTENGAYITIDTAVTLTSSANLNRLETNITNPQASDALGCPSPAVSGISCSGTGTTALTMTGVASRANYDLAIQRIRFRNTSQDPVSGNRTIRVRVRDEPADNYSNYVSTTVNVVAQNDAPTASNDGSPPLGSGHVSVNEGAGLNGIGNILANDNDVDSTITASRNSGAGCDAVSPTEVTSFTLNSNGTFDYAHDGSEPVQDSFTYCAFDGSLYSAVRTVYIDIAAVNDPPTVSGFSGSVGYTEQTPVVIDNTLTISDTDSTLIDRARITISAGYEAGDTLACSGAPPGGITCAAFDVPTRTLTLSGTTTLANYQTAIGLVTFDNPTSDNPSLTPRTIDLDVRDDSLGVSIDYQKNISPITRSNDPPTIAAIGPQVALEDTPADPFTFNVTAVASDVDVDDDTNTGNGSITYSLSGQPAGMTISNANPTHGQISWNPPITGTFGQVYGPITVSVEDGDEDTSAPNSVNFSITVSPPDDDADLVANYNDVCLTVPDATNADNDGDGTPGSDGGVNDGGDVCDLDDDNDGMPDVFEIAEGFDPFDAADAAQDADGDGITNLQEFLDGTNPNFANLVIDATGYLTPFTLPQPDPTTVHPMATSATPDDPGPYRPGRNTIVWTGANISNANLGTSNQTLDVRPLVNFAANQQAEEGVAVTVDVTLNGDPPSYPVTVNYTVSGTANNPTDHDAVSGAVVFNSPDVSETIVFNTQVDALSDPNESVVFTIDSAGNAAVGSNNTHQVTIVEANIAPEISIQFNQGGNPVSSVYAADGNMNISVIVNDVNGGQTHSYDWSGSDNTLTIPGNVATWGAFAPPAVGNYLIDVVVTDAGAPLPSASTRVSRILNVVAGSAPQGPDDDEDGVPNNVDAFDSSAATGDPSNLNLIPDQTVNNLTTQIVQTDPGLKITVGNTAQAANLFGILLTNNDIALYGSGIGTPPVNPNDNFQHFGGVYDFEIRGIQPGQSANVVIPLLSAIPRNAEYRKFSPATGWGSFVINANNSVASASGVSGACPEPGSGDYRSGLNYLDNCLQLTIQDGGPNDTDGRVNGIISDPGTVGAQLSDPEAEGVESGSSRIAPSLLLFMLLLVGFSQRRRLGRGFQA